MVHTPVTTIDRRYSDENAQPTPWPDALVHLRDAELFWVSTVRPDGRLHVTPVVGVWLDDAFYFSSGPDEQKSRNLAASPHCAVTTGCNQWNGLDIVLHGDAVLVRDRQVLHRVAGAFSAKYGSAWAAEVDDDGTFRFPGHATPLVYEVSPTQALGFGKSERFSHTRWDFTAQPV